MHWHFRSRRWQRHFWEPLPHMAGVSSLPCRSCAVWAWNREWELSARRQLHWLDWQCSLGCASVRGCRIVPRIVSSVLVPRASLLMQWVNPGWPPPLPAPAALFPLCNPFLLTKCSAVTFPCTCLFETHKNEQREGERRCLTSKILLYHHAGSSLCSGTDLKTCEAQSTAFKMLPTINS